MGAIIIMGMLVGFVGILSGISYIWNEMICKAHPEYQDALEEFLGVD